MPTVTQMLNQHKEASFTVTTWRHTISTLTLALIDLKLCKDTKERCVVSKLSSQGQSRSQVQLSKSPYKWYANGWDIPSLLGTRLIKRGRSLHQPRSTSSSQLCQMRRKLNTISRSPSPRFCQSLSNYDRMNTIQFKEKLRQNQKSINQRRQATPPQKRLNLKTIPCSKSKHPHRKKKFPPNLLRNFPRLKSQRKSPLHIPLIPNSCSFSLIPDIIK